MVSGGGGSGGGEGGGRETENEVFYIETCFNHLYRIVPDTYIYIYIYGSAP